MRPILVILVILLVITQYRLWFGEGGLHEIRYRRVAVDELVAENQRLQKRNDALRAEVKDLKGGLEAIEEHARSGLGMIREGETFFQVIGQPDPMPGASHTPSEDTALHE